MVTKIALVVLGSFAAIAACNILVVMGACFRLLEQKRNPLLKPGNGLVELLRGIAKFWGCRRDLRFETYFAFGLLGFSGIAFYFALFTR